MVLLWPAAILPAPDIDRRRAPGPEVSSALVSARRPFRRVLPSIFPITANDPIPGKAYVHHF